MLRFLTAGESHGQALVAVIEGMPAGVPIDIDAVTAQLKRRQGGYGRGRRMAIESDKAQVLSGIRRGRTTGAPIALLIPNKDWQNWQKTMHVEPEMPEEATGANRAAVTRPRPGHADLAGALKYDLDRHPRRARTCQRARDRRARRRRFAGASSARAVRHRGAEPRHDDWRRRRRRVAGDSRRSIRAIPADSPLGCADLAVEQQMIAAIDQAKEAGDTLGGAFEVVVTGLPVGLGSYVQWDRKLDGRLAQAIVSIPAIKAVGIGKGPEVARLPGSRIHDEIVPRPGPAGTGHPAVGVARLTNNAGGLEGGVTNGEQLRVTGYMKPIATLMKPLRSVDLTTLEESPAAIERSDVCAVTAAAVVGEAMVSLVVADAFLEKFTGDSLGDIARTFEQTCAAVRARFEAAAASTPAGA